MTMEKNSYELFLKKLGEAFQELRKEHGLSQAELGKKSSRGQSAIGKLERMPAANLPLRVIYEIAETIPVPLSALFYQTEKKVETAVMSPSPSKGESQSWPAVAKKVDALSPKKREQVAKIIEQVLST